jgi:hypothetical protein
LAMGRSAPPARRGWLGAFRVCARWFSRRVCCVLDALGPRGRRWRLAEARRADACRLQLPLQSASSCRCILASAAATNQPWLAAWRQASLREALENPDVSRGTSGPVKDLAALCGSAQRFSRAALEPSQLSYERRDGNEGGTRFMADGVEALHQRGRSWGGGEKADKQD